MRITFCCTGTQADPWLEGLRAALPNATVEAWAPSAPQADHAIVWAPPQAMMDEQPGLKGIFNIGAGVDALMRLKLPAGATVVRLDDAGMSVQMAEYVCHAVIRHFRSFDVCAANQLDARWVFNKQAPRSDFPVGVMGLGVLGERVAKALRHFEFPVNGWSRSPKAVEGVQGFHGEAQFDAFLAASRVLVCLLPLTPDTVDVMRFETLSKLRPGGYVVNVARGGHLVDDDLIALIDSGHLAGATLDVFRIEPLPEDHPFWSHPKITVTPHSSARTLRSESIDQIVGKMLALERGEPIAGVVHAARGY